MDRLTRPDIDTDQTAVRFMGGEVKIQDISDKLLHLILNGPTINSINKDTLRHLVRQLYTELKRYEDLEMTPEAIEHQLTNFSSFLMEMTGGRMSKTNYTVQAMVDEANEYQQRLCDECSDRQQLEKAEEEGRLIVASIKPGDTIYWVLEDNGEKYVSSERVVDVGTRGFFVPEFADGDIESPCDIILWDAVGKECFLTQEEAEAALAKDTDVPSKDVTDTNVGNKEGKP